MDLISSGAGAPTAVICGLTGALLFLYFGGASVINEWLCRPQLQQGAGPLPPGPMGWPVIGNSIRFLKRDPLFTGQGPLSKFGELYKTHILGKPTIVAASPESSRSVLLKNHGRYDASWPKAVLALFGKTSLFALRGQPHNRMRRFFQRPLQPQSLHPRLPKIEAAILATLRSWEGRTVNCFESLTKFVFGAISSIMYSRELDAQDNLLEDYTEFEKGLWTWFTYKIVGTTYYKSLQARSRMLAVFSKVIAQRRSGKVHCDDALQAMLDSPESEELGRITDEEILDNLFISLTGGIDTSTRTLLWCIKMLSDLPDLLADVKMEHEQIRKLKSDPNAPLTVTDLKAMTVTNWVMQEAVRLYVTKFVFREALEDVQYNGLTIPRGWTVMVDMECIHTNPASWPDPLKFNPYRYQTPPDYFVPFGQGPRVCPGNELARLEILVFIHHFITKYDWEVLGNSDEIITGPTPRPKDGLILKVHRK